MGGSLRQSRRGPFRWLWGFTPPLVTEGQSYLVLTILAHESRCLLPSPFNPSRGPFGPSPSFRLLRPLPSGTALLKVFAAPNFFDRNISSGNYNYVFNATTNDPKYTHSLKVDYILNSNNTISGTWNAFNEHHTGSVGIPSAGRLNWPHGPARLLGALQPHLLAHASERVQLRLLNQPANDTYTEDELNKNTRESVGFVAGKFAPSNSPLNVIQSATFGGVPSPSNLVIEGRFPQVALDQASAAAVRSRGSCPTASRLGGSLAVHVAGA